ncbi:MAG: hypothetical protein WCB68_02005 [Pyrinomonadaceae bacterium]
MSIRANVIKVKKDILADVVNDNKNFTQGIQDDALAAILKGQGSPEWETYMKRFIDPGRDDQLQRLMGNDATKGDEDMDRARAYLVADAPCGTTTVLNFGNFASILLDKDLPENPVAPQSNP